MEPTFLNANSGKLLIVGGILLIGMDYPTAGRIVAGAGVIAWLHSQGLVPLPFGL